MNYYYCKECRAVFPGHELLDGYSNPPDDYQNRHCECGSEDYMTVEEYAVEILDSRKTYDHYELHCGPGEAWALRYLISEGTKADPYIGIYKAITYMYDKGESLSDYILENAESFVRFVVDYEEENQQDMAKEYKQFGVKSSRVFGFDILSFKVFCLALQFYERCDSRDSRFFKN